MSQFEQRANIKFYQKLGKSPSETFNMMKQVYGEEALGRSLEDYERSGGSKAVRSESKIEDVSTLVRANRSQSVDNNRLTDGGNDVSLTRRPLSTPQGDSWYSFMLEAESSRGHSVAGRIR
jgi:hypothetical protein